MEFHKLIKPRIIGIVAMVLALTKHTYSYSTGAPTRACADMTPGHGFSVKSDPAPYLVEVSKTQYAPNERIYVRIRACGLTRFKGFLIQPRSAVYPERPAFLGAFLRVQGTRYECVRSGAVLTHSSPDEKQSVTLTWIAPPAAAGHVVFRVTVVQDYRNYWVGINSPVVYDGVSRDLTMMQAFILQSPTDKSCLPGRQSATSTTQSVTETTTEEAFMETTSVVEPTTTRAMPSTTTTTTNPTTTARRTTMTTTTSQASTNAPTTDFPVPSEVFYDYVWETTTVRPEPTTQLPSTSTTTTKQLPTTSTTRQTTTTEYIPPITTTEVPKYEPTTPLAVTTPDVIDTTTVLEMSTEIVNERPSTVGITTTTTPQLPTTSTADTTTTTAATTTTTRQSTSTIQRETTPEVRMVTDGFPLTTTTTAKSIKKQTTTAKSFKKQTSTSLPTTATMTSTTTDLPSPTTTTLIIPTTTTTVIQRTTTTTPPIPTTQTKLDTTRTIETLPVTTIRGLTGHSQRLPEISTAVFRPPKTSNPDSTTFFSDYFDRNQAGTNPPVYYDYDGFSRRRPEIPTDNLPTNIDITREPTFPNTKKDPSTTEWVPTRDWKGQTQYPTTTGLPTTKEILFKPPETPTVTRVRLPNTTTTVYVPTTTVLMPTTVVTTNQEPKPTIRVTEMVLRPDPACGVTQGCFDDCWNGACNYIVSWVPEREKTIFEIRTKPRISGQYWTAVGFSADKKMGLDSVTECITEGDKINVYQSYNLDYYRNMRLLTPTLGILDQSGSYRDGIFHCKFTRENFVVGEKDVFDLSKDWYMMFAEGPAVNEDKMCSTKNDPRGLISEKLSYGRLIRSIGIKIPHRYDVVPPVSVETIDLQQYPPVHETYNYRMARTEDIRVVNVTDVIAPPSTGRRIAMDEECGSSRSCFQDCAPSGCHFIVSWTSHDDYVTFRTKAQMNDTRDIWIALAFSDDKTMGDDSVIQCVVNGNGEIDIRHSFNDGKNNVRIENSDVGLTNTSASLVDGIFECDFIRQRHVGEYEHIFNLDRKWTLLFAHGKSKKGIMLPHSLDHRPHISDSPVDFRKSAPSHITASTFFIKIHASVMIFAWILCASVASVVGRYFQPYWWGEKMLGSKAWIKVHWLFVLLTCAAVIAGFTVIFVGVNGISQLYEHPETGFNGTHPIMGLIVTLLALLNPLLLCLKPSEDSSGRAFFNCLYWLVEIGAHVLAVVTIYAGFGLTSDFVPHFFTFMLIGFTVYQILILLFMEALKSFDAKKTIEKKKIYLYEMQIRPWHARKNNSLAAYMDLNHTSKGLKQTAFATHLLLLSALTTTMLVLIITGYH